MMIFRWNSAATLVALLAMVYVTSCGGSDPREMVIGEWSVHPQDVKQSNIRDVSQLKMTVSIAEDGTFVLTGSQVFKGLSGTDNVKGTYEFLDDFTMHVEMKTRAFDYEPTDYAITKVSRNELLLNSESHAVTLIRE